MGHVISNARGLFADQELKNITKMYMLWCGIMRLRLSGFLLGVGNLLFFPSVHVNVTSYCEKTKQNMFPKLLKLLLKLILF